MKPNDQQRGVGLIEELIAALVFAVGIAAVVQLQGTFFKNSSAANARSAAMSIAQEKIEDLRGFQVTDSSHPYIFTFTAITGDGPGNNSDTGGRLLCNNQTDAAVCTQVLPSVSITKDNITFNRSWLVTNYYYVDTGTPPVGVLTTPVPVGTIPDQKQITVTVAWTDTDGSSQTATLSTVINKNSSAASTALLANNIGGSGKKPVVSYTPSTDPGVVSESVGANVDRETLVPTSNGSDQVKFTAYTYGAGSNLLRQEDFLTVSCNCAFNGTGQARTASFAKWDDTTGTFKDQEGDLVSKDTGCVTNGKKSDCVNNADELCTSCCNDHLDPGASAVDSSSAKYCDPANDGVLDRCFDPFRGPSDYTNGKHNHYTTNGTLANSGAYLESCRMKRINGFWRVYQDWHRVDLSAFPLNDLAQVSGQVSSTETIYATYIQGIINEILKDTNIVKFNGQSFTLPTKPTVVNHTTSNPISVSVGGQQTLTARAVYVDYLSSTLLTQVRAEKTAQSDYLIDVPFYEVDVTNRVPKCATASSAYGGWCPPGANQVDVGAGLINDNNGNGLASGVVKGVSATSSPVNVSFDMRRSNSGLMGLSEPVDVSGATNSDILRDTALVAVSVTGSGSTTHALSVTLTGGSPISGSLSVTPSSGTGSCPGSGTSYNCTVPNGVAGSLSFSGSAANSDSCTGTGSYNASDLAITLTISCAPLSTTHTLTVTLNPPIGSTLSTGGTLTSTLATNCKGSVTSYTCNELNTASGTATLDYKGSTISGSICSGAGTYTASGTAPHAVNLAVSCVATRTLNVCLTKDNFTSGTLLATPTGESQISCSTPSGSCGSGNDAGKSSTCSVTSGVGGTLSFTGSASGNKTCAATSPYGVNDTAINLEIACR